MLNQRRTETAFGPNLQWWGYYHGVWVQIDIIGYEVEPNDPAPGWFWSAVRSVSPAPGRRRSLGTGDSIDEASAIREAFDALRREVRS